MISRYEGAVRDVVRERLDDAGVRTGVAETVDVRGARLADVEDEEARPVRVLLCVLLDVLRAGVLFALLAASSASMPSNREARFCKTSRSLSESAEECEESRALRSTASISFGVFA